MTLDPKHQLPPPQKTKKQANKKTPWVHKNWERYCIHVEEKSTTNSLSKK